MYTIKANCVDDALREGLALLDLEGEERDSRNGKVLVMPAPVMTVNHNPLARVSFDAKRDANPFFHLMESLWMLAGRRDASWLNQFIGDFSARYADYGSLLHGAYGFRWRKHFDVEGGGAPGLPDQLETAIALLRKNPDDRRVVIAMWDPAADLGADKKDIPCNTHIYCRVREEVRFTRQPLSDQDKHERRFGGTLTSHVLDLTVCCRSNDAIWGAHGANAVHFSVLQEYLAARIGVGIGKLYQLSNNYHAYVVPFNKVFPLENIRPVPPASPTRIVTIPHAFDQDLKWFFEEDWANSVYHNEFFHRVAVPMRLAYMDWREKDYDEAINIISSAPACDWIAAAASWFQRRRRLSKL